MGRYKTERQLSFIRKALPPTRSTILDIGGGGGRLAIPLSDLGHQLTVIDISSEALRLLRSRSGDTIVGLQSDLVSFSPPGVFDVALAIDTLKYMAEASIAELFAKMNSLLAPGGMLVVCEINQDSWRNRLSERLGRRRGPGYNIASTDGYREALAGAGFEIVREQGFLWMPLAFNSDSGSVRVFAAVEKTLRLGNWLQQSPWLLIAARKTDTPRAQR